MAQEDVLLSSMICYKVLPYSAVALFLLLVVRYGKNLRQRFFAFVYSRFLAKKLNKKLESFKHQLFADLSDFESRDLLLRNEGLLRMLEIGPAYGANFQFYPKNCRLVCYDTNAYFRKYLFENQEQYPHVNLQRFVVSGGENLVMTEDESVDVVVATLVNCSVTSVEQVLKEIHRVLSPGGRYYFIDHVIAPKESSTYGLQTVVRPFIKFIMGCDIQCDVASAVRKASFSKVDITTFDPGVPFPFGLLIKDFVMGCATK